MKNFMKQNKVYTLKLEKNEVGYDLERIWSLETLEYRERDIKIMRRHGEGTMLQQKKTL